MIARYSNKAPKMKRGAPPKQKHSCGGKRENNKQKKVSKRLSRVATEKCKRLFHPLKKKVLWEKNRYRIKERSWNLYDMSVKIFKSNMEMRKGS